MPNQAWIASRIRLLREGRKADFKIICKDRQWNVDRHILVAGSQYFRTLCMGNFSEASKGQVTIHDQEPEVIDQVLIYLYTGGYYSDLRVLSKRQRDRPTSHGDSQNDIGTMEKSFEGKDLHWHCARSRKVEPKLRDASSSDVTKVLVTGVLVYQCAVMMGMDDLQEQAKRSFLDREIYFLKANFITVLETVFRNTATDDQLVNALMVCCVTNYKIVGECREVVHVLNTYEPQAWDLGTDLYAVKEAQGKKIHDLETRERLYKADIKALWARIISLENRVRRLEGEPQTEFVPPSRNGAADDQRELARHVFGDFYFDQV